jgi:amino-acid N-acetyltransferase
MTIEPAAERDLPDVHAMLERQQLPLDGVDGHVGTMVVARDEGVVVGAAAVELHADGALLRSVVVDRAVQGRRIGHALTAAALDVVRDHGRETVFLLTTTAEAFFRKFGFETVARDAVPASVQASIEFQSACPASATVMRKQLTGR